LRLTVPKNNMKNKAYPSRISALLAACDRAQAPPTAPARGLTLVSVDYGDV
jgi:tRNA U38,U39,U40 pseudouridine synthase TruA